MKNPAYNGLIHAGAGTGLFLVQISAFFPGFLPFLALTAVFAAVVLVPLVIVGVVAALLAAPPYALWRLLSR